jgi:transcriptional regulator with XRE-family HTH domain
MGSEQPSARPQNLLAWRERAGLTQEEAAKLLGTSQSVYSRWEAGLVKPRGPAQVLIGLFLAGFIVGAVQEAVEEWAKHQEHQRRGPRKRRLLG